MRLFIGSEALAAGRVTRNDLRHHYTRLAPDVYGPSDPTLTDRAIAAHLWSRGKGIVTGVAASALHRAFWVADDVPIELLGRSTRPPAGVIVYRDAYAPDEVTTLSGIAVATAARTMFDLGRHLPRDQAVQRIDALLCGTRFDVKDVLPLIERYPAARNIRRLRVALSLADAGAESPRETWLRLALTDAGMAPTGTQIPVFDEAGALVAKVDMGWEGIKVGIQYDGRHHQTDRVTYVRDQKVNRALARLEWNILRVIAEDPLPVTLARVDAMLSRRGWRAA